MDMPGVTRRLFGRESTISVDEIADALRAHSGLMITAAARVLGSLHDAEDVVQDVAEKLLAKPPADVTSWPALLKTMAVHKAIDRNRQSQQRREWVPEAASAPDELITQSEQADLLRVALHSLQAKDALLFSLHYFADLDHGAIAEQMKMTRNAVAVALHRLRERLAIKVQKLCAGEVS